MFRFLKGPSERATGCYVVSLYNSIVCGYLAYNKSVLWLVCLVGWFAASLHVKGR